ncbi:MAG: hypothetical protein ACI4BI_06010 [Anaerotardibacter sp.]
MEIFVDQIKNSDFDSSTPYDVRTSTNQLLAGFSQALLTQDAWLNVWHVAELTSVLLGTRLLVGDASHYIFDYARRSGFDVPAVPYAGNGELKKFFKEEGVTNIPEWYAKIGIREDSYQNLYEKTIVAVSNGKGARLVLLLDGQLYNNYGDFRTLIESGFIKKAKPQQLDVVLKKIYEWLIKTGDL